MGVRAGFWLMGLVLVAGCAPGVPGREGVVREWVVDGVTREALVFAPERGAGGAVPVVFVFHGHGGTMGAVARHGFHGHWREALVVYPQGLPTATGRDLEGARPGWQQGPGAQGDRDLRFFDAMVGSFREAFGDDLGGVFAAGHSNGGGFTYLLWAARGEVLAGIGVSAGGGRNVRLAEDLKPLPVLHMAGERDRVVAFANQERTMAVVRRVNGCAEEGEAWGVGGPLPGVRHGPCSGAPFVAVVHGGDHGFPAGGAEVIVGFFRGVGA